MPKTNKLLVVLGPTASGKTNFAAKLAFHLKNAEIISADSRQIYKGMDIGTGKDLNEYTINDKCIPYHLIDIISPNYNYSVYDFKKDFTLKLATIKTNNNLPILCGGTGLYIESVLLNYNIPNVPPNPQLRSLLAKQSIKELINYMKFKFKNTYQADYHTSKRRIIRALEIKLSQKQNDVVDMNSNNKSLLCNSLVLGLYSSRQDNLICIKKRLIERINNGMIDEVEDLIKGGLNINRLKYFGLEYKYIAKYLNNEIDLNTMTSELNTAINRFAKRQMTFFRRMEKRGIKIKWININESINIKSLLTPFLNR